MNSTDSFYLSSGMWLTGEIAGLLRGLTAAVAALPACEYRHGYLAALAAVALATGAVDAEESDLAKTITRMLSGGTS